MREGGNRTVHEVGILLQCMYTCFCSYDRAYLAEGQPTGRSAEQVRAQAVRRQQLPRDAARPHQ